ncbi:hypothetical protein [Nonomuraea sp. NPDC049141]|uniref:hypothetical protein n=1 Tax=Nonomuraea sp. NPDC049141 TaxID=3155500 RepID=UPI0033DECC5C
MNPPTHLGFARRSTPANFPWLSRGDAAADILLRQRHLERPRERIARPVVA